VEDRDGRDSLIERPQQFWSFAIADDVLGKLAQVEVVGDQIGDLIHLSGLKLVAQLLAALPTGDELTPGLSGYRKLWSGWAVPAIGLGDVSLASGNFCWQWNVHPFTDRLIYVLVRIIPQQPPERRVLLKGNSTFLLAGVEQVGNHSIFGNVLGDIFLGVVSPHLLLVDILLENVTQHVVIDFSVVAQGARVEMPVVLIKEGKEPLKRLIGNVDANVLLLQRVQLEQATVEVRHLPQKFFQIGSTLGG